MENKNNEDAAAPAAENGTNAAEEVSSTTQTPPEPTKRSLRVQTWKKIQDKKCGVAFNAIFNRIPGFIDSDKAANLLAETDEFKKAKNIKVNIDRALHAVKMQTLLTGKTLYLPSVRDSSALFLRVDVPADATDEQKKDILNVQDVQQHRTEINLDNKVILDMVIIGSVLVSRDGYRIGRGNGFADLDIGLLIEIGAITPDTVIATMVHDVQVADSLPEDLFQKYDTPLDLIVTPTEVIRVAKRPPRPTGIFWQLLSERRLKIVPVLQALKENEEKAGKIITLKEEDTDIEQNQNNRNRRRGMMRRRFNRRNQRRAVSQTDTEQQGDQKPRNQRRNRRFTNRRRRPTKSEGDQSGVEGKSQERKGPPADRKQRLRKTRMTRDFCIKLSNITRDVRVKDLKVELRKRECHPIYISWKGQFGKCYLHFGNRTGAPSTEEDINKVLSALNDFQLTVTSGGNASGAEGDAATPQQTKTINVNVELIKFDEKKVTGRYTQVKPTKRLLRSQTWRKLHKQRSGAKTPTFENSDKAAILLSETEEFKNANNIKVGFDATLASVKLQTLLAGKTLFLSTPQYSNALYVRVNLPEGATSEQIQAILDTKYEKEEHYTDILLDNKVKLDMVVIGSVLASRNGYRVGSGNGFVDVDIGLLIQVGAITPDTVIVTVVSDLQVVDTMSADMFGKNDTPVDMIITPTEVIRVAKRLPRPAGIFWEMVSKRRFKIIAVLQELKKVEEKAGKFTAIREEDTDVDHSTEEDVGTDESASSSQQNNLIKFDEEKGDVAPMVNGDIAAGGDAGMPRGEPVGATTA